VFVLVADFPLPLLCFPLYDLVVLLVFDVMVANGVEVEVEVEVEVGVDLIVLGNIFAAVVVVVVSIVFLSVEKRRLDDLE